MLPTDETLAFDALVKHVKGSPHETTVQRLGERVGAWPLLHDPDHPDIDGLRDEASDAYDEKSAAEDMAYDLKDCGDTLAECLEAAGMYIPPGNDLHTRARDALARWENIQETQP